MIGRPLRSDHGAAVITTILVAALLLQIGTIASQQAVVSFIISHRLTESAQALVAAETAIAAVLADLAREPSFARLASADGKPFPFLDGAAPARPLPQSFEVETRLRSRSESHIDVIATARGRNRARRVVVTTIERGDRPFLPAALYFAAESPAISSTGALEISGAATDDVAAIASPSHAQVEALADALAASGARIAGGTTATDWEDLDDLIARVRAIAQLLPGPLHGSIAPGVWASSGSLDAGDAGGTGVWLIDGDLAVDGTLAFTGLLVVLGDIRVGAGSEMTIRGGLVQGGAGRFLDCDGRIAIDYDRSALNDIDSAHPGLLDRRARVIGWRDDAP